MAGMSATQLLAELDITYRQLDHWCRTGVIRLAYDAQGSGSRRWITGPECAAIRDVCREHARIEMLKARLRSGEFFAACLAHHHDEQNRTTTHAPQGQDDEVPPRPVQHGNHRDVPAPAGTGHPHP